MIANQAGKLFNETVNSKKALLSNLEKLKDFELSWNSKTVLDYKGFLNNKRIYEKHSQRNTLRANNGKLKSKSRD